MIPTSKLLRRGFSEDFPSILVHLHPRELASRLSAVLKYTSQFSAETDEKRPKSSPKIAQNPAKMVPKCVMENIPAFCHFLAPFGLPKWSHKCSKIGVKGHPGPQRAPRELPRVPTEHPRPPKVSKSPPLGPSGAPFWSILVLFWTLRPYFWHL